VRLAKAPAHCGARSDTRQVNTQVESPIDDGNSGTRDIFCPLWPYARLLSARLSPHADVRWAPAPWCVVASEVLLSPILVRPVREQLEHDRVIRLLQAKYKRKFDVAINPGHEQTAPVGPPQSPWYPDLVLLSNERSKKLVGVVEVETAESVNHLEAMSQWVAFGKLKVEFHLYVPVSGVDSARRLCADLQIPTTEIWAYHALGDQIRFTAVQRSANSQTPPDVRPRAVAEPKPVRPREAQPSRAAKPPAPPARPKSPARRAAPASAAKARPTKARSAAPRRAAAKAPARKAAPASRAQKRK